MMIMMLYVSAALLVATIVGVATFLVVVGDKTPTATVRALPAEDGAPAAEGEPKAGAGAG